MQRVVIVGGGVVGASTAYHLAREGIGTILIDRHDSGHATAAGAGIISPGTSQRPLPDFYPLAADAVRYYPELVSALAEVGETGTRYEVVGKLILAFTKEEEDAIPAQLDLFNQRRATGMPGLGNISVIERLQAQSLFPGLGDIRAAIHVPEAARVDGDHLRNALIAGARHHGATVRSGDVSLDRHGNTVHGVLVDGESIGADAVIVATGAWTDRLLETIGRSVAVEPQRGQIMHLTMPGADTSRWPILGGSGDQYILTFGPNRVVMGATRETGSGFDVRMTAGGLKTVLDHALRVAPGLATGTVHEVRIGLRPVSADGLPFLGHVPGYPNVVVATGHGPTGLQLGPYSGQIAARLVTGEVVDTDLRPFALDRGIGQGRHQDDGVLGRDRMRDHEMKDVV